MPKSLTIEAVIAVSVSAVTPLPVARNTATRAGCWLLTASFTLAMLFS